MHLRFRALKPLVIAVSIACVSVTGCSKEEKSATEGEVQQLLSRAQAYQLQGQYRAAVIEAKNALQKDPNNPAAHVLIAKIYSDLGDTKQALSTLEKIDPTSDAELYVALLDTLIERGKGQTALELSKKPPADLTAEQKESLQLNTARALVLTGDFAKAGSLYQQLRNSSNEPIAFDAATGLAAIAFKANNPTEANSILDTVLAKSPKNTDALVLKAAIAYKAKDLEAAEELLSQALIGLPNTDLLTVKRATVLDSLVNVLTLEGRTAEAMVYTKMLAEARPGAENTKALFEEALELLKAGKYKDAEQKLLQVYNENNAPDAAGRLLGIIRMQEGDLEGAEQYFSQHIDPETANPEVLRLLAENELRLNKSAEALKIIEENINKSPDNADLLSVYGLAALAEGEEAKGLAAIEKALTLDPQRTKLRAALADHYLRKGKLPAAIEQMKLAIEKTPDDLALRTQLVRILFLAKRTDDVKQQAVALEKDFANNAEALSIAGSANLQLKLPEQSRVDFDKALQIDKNNINSLIGVALLEMQAKKWDSATEYADKVLDIDPNNVRAYKLLAGISTRTNHIDDFLEKLGKMSSDKINAWGPDVTLAEYYLATGDVEKALTHSKEALARSGFKDYPKTLASRIYLELARQSIGDKSITDARRYLMEGLQTNPHNLDMLDMLAHVEINAEKYTEVDKIITQIRTAYPKSVVPDLIEIDKMRKQGNKVESLAKLKSLWASRPADAVAIRVMPLLDTGAREKFAEEWGSRLPDSAEAQIFLAMQQQGKGNIDAAVAGYEKALTVSPNDARALNNLAWIKFERKQMPDALELSAKAAAIAPNDAAVLDTYGWILFNNGDKEKAQAVLKRALELSPDVAEVKQHYEAATK